MEDASPEQFVRRKLPARVTWTERPRHLDLGFSCLFFIVRVPCSRDSNNSRRRPQRQNQTATPTGGQTNLRLPLCLPACCRPAYRIPSGSNYITIRPYKSILFLWMSRRFLTATGPCNHLTQTLCQLAPERFAVRPDSLASRLIPYLQERVSTSCDRTKGTRPATSRSPKMPDTAC